MRIPLLFCSLALLGAAVHGQSSVLVGGAGSYSSEGTFDPGLLSDDDTVASARLVFTLDKANARLTLDVENTSPVLTGVPNPLLTRVYFNAPAAITGMSLTAQNASQGAPAFVLAFDPDRTSAPNPNGAGPMGAFSVALVNPGGVGGAIANPDADTVVAPYVVVGPAQFQLALSGDLTGVEESDFISLLSSTSPGGIPSIAAAKFQSGGERGASGFLSNGDQFCPEAASVEDLGGGCGATLTSTLPRHTVPWTITVQSSLPKARGVLLASNPIPSSVFYKGCEIVLQLPSKFRMGVFVTDANGFLERTTILPYDPACCGLAVTLQALVIKGAGLAEATNGLVLRFGS
jgi:hypothetical protein